MATDNGDEFGLGAVVCGDYSSILVLESSFRTFACDKGDFGAGFKQRWYSELAYVAAGTKDDYRVVGCHNLLR